MEGVEADGEGGFMSRKMVVLVRKDQVSSRVGEEFGLHPEGRGMRRLGIFLEGSLWMDGGG